MTVRPSRLARLVRNRSGVAATEFALALPFLMTVSMWGIETANYAITNMRVSQLAMQISDDASRIGDTSTLTDHKIYESDIDDLLIGANVMGGQSIDMFEHGRVIISSLEVVPATDDQQYIHWQRCKGKKTFVSDYGNEGKGLHDTIVGLGPAGKEITANSGEAVMFVEVSYDYQPLIASAFVRNTEIKATAAFNVRDDRDLSQIHQRDAGHPDPVADCGTYDGFA